MPHFYCPYCIFVSPADSKGYFTVCSDPSESVHIRVLPHHQQDNPKAKIGTYGQLGLIYLVSVILLCVISFVSI